jgi:hypothetical protein
LQQLQPYVLDALYGATSIKFASKVSDAAAHALARDMHTTPEFILNQPSYHFAAYVRGMTDSALSIAIPEIDFNRMPRMTKAEHERVRKAMREQYAVRPGDTQSAQPKPLPEPVTPNRGIGAAPPASTKTADPLSDDWRS